MSGRRVPPTDPILEFHLTFTTIMNTIAKSLLIALTAILTASSAPAAGPVKVKLATLAPKGSSYTKHLQVMGEAWKKASSDGVTLTLFPDGSMGSEADMVKRMRLNQLQAAMVTAAGLAEIEPAVSGLETMPRIYRSLDEVDFIGEKMHPMLEKRLAAKGFIVLFWTDAGFIRFFSKNPMVTPEDLRKNKLFASSSRPEELEIYRSVGCNPVPLEIADVLPGLQNGLITAISYPPNVALAVQLDTFAPNMLDMNWVPLVGAAVINKKAWDSMTPETQAIVLKAAKEAGKAIQKDARRESEESIEAMKKRGLKVFTLTPEIETDWDKVVSSTYPKLRGVSVPADIFDEITSQLAAYRASKTNNPAPEKK
jgi:TRAP-type C4-dicarboxylate transport system substrate-binding protein